MITSPVQCATTLLFVPGDRPDRFARALTSGADVVVVDLEDAVASGRKDLARDATLRLLSGPPQPTALAVRINAPSSSAEGVADLAALSESHTNPLAAVMVPKADRDSGLTEIAGRCGAPTIALIESASGIIDAPVIARQPGVVRLALGPLDLCAELALDPAADSALAPARFALAASSAHGRLPAPIDGPSTEIREHAVISEQTRAAAAAGFSAKLCIHPSQIGPVAAAFAPTSSDVAWARAVVAGAVDGVGELDGQMVDRPVLLRAQRILARANPESQPNVRRTGPASSR